MPKRLPSHKLLEGGVSKFSDLALSPDSNVSREAVEMLLDMTNYGFGEGGRVSLLIVKDHPYVLPLKGNSVFCDPPDYTTIEHAVSYHGEPADRMFQKMPEYSALRDSNLNPVLHNQAVASYRLAGRIVDIPKLLMVEDGNGFNTAQLIVDNVLQGNFNHDQEPGWLEVLERLVDRMPGVLGMQNSYGGTDRSRAYGIADIELNMGQAIASKIYDYYWSFRGPTGSSDPNLIATPIPDEKAATFTNILREHVSYLDNQTRSLLRSFP